LLAFADVEDLICLDVVVIAFAQRFQRSSAPSS
jgi:hypothetical protein